jgi:hypothetical protein
MRVIAPTNMTTTLAKEKIVEGIDPHGLKNRSSSNWAYAFACGGIIVW